MVLAVVGVVFGIGLGALWFGDQGWIIGAFLGGFAGILVRQANRIVVLESAVKTLTEEQTSAKRQLKLLKSFPVTSGVKSETDKSAKVKAPTDGVNEPSPALHTESDRAISASTSNAVIATHQLSSPNKDPAELEITEEELCSIALAHTSDSIEVPLAAKPRPTESVTPQPPAPQSLTPREPGLGGKIIASVRRFFTEGNPIVRIGMVIMFFGVSFLVKYAAGQGLFPIEFRLAGVVSIAIALLVLGWKTRTRPGAYGLVLQGGGIAIIYLTLFASAKIYGLIPLSIAFGLLFLVVVFGVLLALLQNAQVLALLATAGGFLAPILTSSDSGNHVGLFSFYLILNFGILSIAVYKAWRLLNWVGFMFTFVITAAWGVLKYDPIFYSSTQPFLITFFLLYLIVSILFSFKQPTNLKGVVDGSLLFGLPLVAFGLQTLLLKHSEHGLAISAVILAMIYILLAAGLARRYMQTHRILVESFLALGVSFATLAVPLALDASWTSVTWALEATGLIWVGLRQFRLRPRFVGYLLHIASVISLVFVHGLSTGLTPLIDGDFLALVLLALTSFTIAYLLTQFSSVLGGFEKPIIPCAISLGILWWFVAGINDIHSHVVNKHIYAVILLFATVSAIALMLVSKKLAWNLLNNSVYALLPFVWLLSFIVFVDNSYTHPAQAFVLLATLTFFATQYRFLFTKERDLLTGAQDLAPSASSNLLSLGHIFTAWGLFLLIFWEVVWQKENLNLHGTAALMLWFAAIVVPVVFLIIAGQKKLWPFVAFEGVYANWIPAPLFFLAGFWFFTVCGKHTGNTEHYLPLLNPLDLGQFAIVLIFAYAVRREFMNRLSFISGTHRIALLGIMLFVWVNVVTLRAMSRYQDIPYEFYALWDAVQVQMALSILWSVCALLVMNLSRRIKRRELWMIGAGLLGLVVLKLATKDLSGSGTLAGIVSFMVVGALMLLIGFLSPIPAKPTADIQDNNDPDVKEDDPEIKPAPFEDTMSRENAMSRENIKSPENNKASVTNTGPLKNADSFNNNGSTNE